MTKKGWTRVLMVVVAGLWAYNIYRTVENYQIKVENQDLQVSNNFSFSPIVFNKDSFDLVLADVDPFLKGSSRWKRENTYGSSDNNNQSQSSQRTVVKSDPKPTSQKWPDISYFGYVKNRDQEKTSCLLSLNNKMLRLSSGDEYDGITVMATYRDSVILVLNNSKKTVLIKE